MRLGLRSKTLLPTLSAVILCMALASYFSARKASEELWAELVHSSQIVAKNLGDNAGTFAGDVLGATIIQSRSNRVSKALLNPTADNVADAREALLDLKGFDPAVQGINVLDATGEVIYGDDPKSKGNFADREYFKKAMTGEANISEPVISRVTNKPVFMAAAPLKSGGKIIGIIYARVDLGRFSKDIVEPVKVGQSGYAYMVSGAGTVFSHPDPNQVLKMKLSETDWGKQILGKESGSVTYRDGGVERTAVFARDKTTG